jgi:arsenical pump membrane protein
MPLLTAPHAATWVIAGIATLGVILRPFRWPEAVWAVSGAVVLVAAGLLPWMDAVRAVGKGGDVYLFLTGMMLLAEMARAAGLFGHVAARAARRAAGDPRRLFALVYGVGVVVTVFLSNDATAVVLTPAVFAVARAARAEPLPYLLICAFIANAASFVLPISNPANLVIYGSHMPPLLEWLPRYGLASVASIVVTFLVLRWTQRHELSQAVATDVPVPILSSSGKTAAAGIAVTAIVLLGCSAFDTQLGLPTAIAGAVTALVVLALERKMPWKTLGGISWGVLPLVAGLFVLVEALDRTGVIGMVATFLQQQAQRSASDAAWGVGIVIAVASNLVNNLPAGLIAGSAVQAAHVSDQVTRAILIGVDLGPNLSVTGSLATILWLGALRREGHSVGAWTFLKLGFLVMPPALILSLAAALLP